MTVSYIALPFNRLTLKRDSVLSLFQLSVVFLKETSHIICIANQMTGFYMERTTGQKWVKKAVNLLKRTVKCLLKWVLNDLP